METMNQKKYLKENGKILILPFSFKFVNQTGAHSVGSESWIFVIV